MRDLVEVGFGWSENPDPYAAGVQAAEMALKALVEEANLALVFSTVDYNSEKLMAGIKKVMGIVPVHGGTSFTGTITPLGFKSRETGVVGVLALGSPDIVLGVGESEISEDAVLAGRRAAQAAFENAGSPDWEPNVILMLAAPGREEEIIEGIESVMADVPIIGGSAADNTVEGNWHVFANDRVLADGVVVTAIYGAPSLGWAYGSGYKPTDKKAIATQAEGRVLSKLRGQAALEVYAEWTGKDPQKLQGMNILGESILNPLGVYDEENDFYLVKHPGIGEEDGSITLFAQVQEGEEITLMEATVDDLIQEVGTTIKAAMEDGDIAKEEVATVLLIHCGGRRGAIGERMDEIVTQVREVAGDVPFIGYCTFGEQGCLLDGTNVHCDLLLSALVIGN